MGVRSRVLPSGKGDWWSDMVRLCMVCLSCNKKYCHYVLNFSRIENYIFKWNLNMIKYFYIFHTLFIISLFEISGFILFQMCRKRKINCHEFKWNFVILSHAYVRKLLLYLLQFLYSSVENFPTTFPSKNAFSFFLNMQREKRKTVGCS